MTRYYSDSLAPLSCFIDVFLVSAFPMLIRKGSQPSSLNHTSRLLLARLFSTRGHPLSSCRKGTRISETSALQRVGGDVYVITSVCMCMMCVSIYVCIYMSVTSGL